MNEVVPSMKPPRVRYIERLYKIEAKLRSDNAKLVSDARRDLALLRRGLAGNSQISAYSVVFRDEDVDTEPNDGTDGRDRSYWITDDELKVWLLVGGLFALHPLVSRADQTKARSFGAAMGALRSRLASSASVDRRMDQLLGLDQGSLPHYLRQVISLLSANDVAVHYAQLLDDLLVLLGPAHRTERAAKIRLRWAREYHMLASPPRTDTDSETADETEAPEKSQ